MDRFGQRWRHTWITKIKSQSVIPACPPQAGESGKPEMRNKMERKEIKMQYSVVTNVMRNATAII